MFPRFDDERRHAADRQGHERLAGRGGRQGRLRLLHRGQWSRSGEKVILVRRETNPDDLDGMIAAQGILTSRGGKTSPRGGRRARHGQDLCLRRRGARRRHQAAAVHRPGGAVVEEGDVISIDGTSGEVYLGEVPVVPSPVVEYFEGRSTPTS